MSKFIHAPFFVGYKYTNKQGLEVEVVEYQTTKKITVRFAIDGTEVKTKAADIRDNRPLHPTYGKVQVGDTFPCHDGDTVEVLEVESTMRIRVRWQSDGTEGWKDIVTLKKGHNRHPTKGIPQVGQKFKTNNYGDVKVVEYRSAIDVEVEFDDGVRLITSTNSLMQGTVRHPYCYCNPGKEFTTNSGWKCKVLQYTSADDILVQWQDGSTSTECSGDLRNGCIKPLMQPSVFGVGYFGIGRFVPRTHKVGEYVDQRLYDRWVFMLKRCYDEGALSQSKGRSYEDVYVCDEWLNFQNFAEWALNQPFVFADGYHLDKDLLSYGNKTYAPGLSCFIPAEVNMFLTEGKTGTFYRGVNIIEPKTPNAAVGYVARCNTSAGREYLGFYPTPELAAAAYKKRKEEYAKELATTWKHGLSQQAYDALMNYTVQ